jgi:hypothetical protein
MNQKLGLAALLASSSVFAANFGTTPVVTPSGAVTTTASAVAPASPVGPQLGATFRIVKADGATLIDQGQLSNPGVAMATINVSEKDAFAAANGKCAFNVKYDEASSVAANATTNRLYSNDGLIAVNSAISLVPGVLKTIWTQPYLVAGMNNVRVVVNADGALPSTKWVRVNVAGSCGAKAPVVATPAPVVTPVVPVAVKAPAPVVAPTPAPVVKFAPGSPEWNNLNTVWGYSNYGTTQLKGKGYGRYDEFARLNAAVTAIIGAKIVDQPGYNSIMTTWNTFVTEPAFKTAMAAIVVTPGQK